MNALSTHRRAFAHAAWATDRCLTALEAIAQPPSPAIRWMAHVAAAETVWLERVLGTGAAVPIWPTHPLAECRARSHEIAGRWAEYLASLTPPALGQRIAYTNSRGDRFADPLQDVLQHVVLHGMHHRGQVLAAIREAGATPPAIDFIHAVRQGALA